MILVLKNTKTIQKTIILEIMLIIVLTKEKMTNMTIITNTVEDITIYTTMHIKLRGKSKIVTITIIKIGKIINMRTGSEPRIKGEKMKSTPNKEIITNKKMSFMKNRILTEKSNNRVNSTI